MKCASTTADRPVPPGQAPHRDPHPGRSPHHHHKVRAPYYTLRIRVAILTLSLCYLINPRRIFRGGLNFSDANNAVQSIVVCLGPLIYGAKAYMSAMKRKEEYRAALTNIYRLHNISNNAGVVSTLLEEAHEMDDCEAILAYYTLMVAGKPLTRTQVDTLAESKLRSLSDRPPEEIKIDFDVPDALEKLRDFGLVKLQGDRFADPENVTYEAIPLIQAIQKLSDPVRLFPWHVPEDNEWSACTELDSETGKTLRYRFNRRTKQAVEQT